MSMVLPLLASFLVIGLFAKRMDWRTYTLLMLTIALVSAVRFVKG